MTGITLTAAMRANLLSLQGTGKLLDQTQLRLATGNKVNSALDNPINFFAAQSLNQRASSLSALLDGMGQGIQTLQATNQAITTLTSYVSQLKSIANSAKSDLNNTTTVNTLETAGASGLASAAVADLTTIMSVGDSFSLKDSTGTAHSFTITTGETLQNLVDSINAVDGLSANIVYGDGVTKSSATVDGTGAPNGALLANGSAYLNIVTTDSGTITAADVGTPAGPSLIAALGIGAASVAVKTGGSAAVDITSYADVLTQIGQTVTDANYQGNNLIDGKNNDLTVQVNEHSTGAISIDSKNLTAVAGMGLDANASSWTSSANIDASITKIEAALTTLQTTASGFANSLSMLQTRQDFTNNLVNTLQDGSSLLTIADKNEEGANLLALQTQQQLGIQALSLSSQANQSVLRLFS